MERAETIPKVEHLLNQIDREIELATSPVMRRSGWTTSGILLVLLPMLWALIREVAARSNDKEEVLCNWMLIFVLLSLLLDIYHIWPAIIPAKFTSQDVMNRLQWSYLFNHRPNFAAVIRYVIILFILVMTNFNINRYTVRFAIVFYALLLVGNLAGAAMNYIPVLVPTSINVWKQYVSIVLSVIGFVVDLFFVGALWDRHRSINPSDLLIAGLALGFFYLARVLTTQVVTQYVFALEELRHRLAVGDTDTVTARRQLSFVKEGMLVSEAIEDYTNPLRNALTGMRVHLQQAIDELTRGKPDRGDTPTPGETNRDTSTLIEQWKEHEVRYNLFEASWEEYQWFRKSRRFRMTNWVIRRYRRSSFRLISVQTRGPLLVIFDGLKTECCSTSRTWATYKSCREDFIKNVSDASLLGIVDKLDNKCGTFKLPTTLAKTRDALGLPGAETTKPLACAAPTD